MSDSVRQGELFRPESAELTLERLRYVLSYDPETGVFRWRVPRSGVERHAVAGTIDRAGYRIICVDHRRYFAARLAYFYMTGLWPSPTVDHINRDRSDDRWSNLREASYAEQALNRDLVRPVNPGLPVGVYRNPWRIWSQIMRDGVPIYLGSFASVSEARAAYVEAAAILDD